MNDWPQTRAYLEETNWQFERRTSCAGQKCKRTVEWWRTPSGRWVLLEQDAKDLNSLRWHSEVCPNAKELAAR